MNPAFRPLIWSERIAQVSKLPLTSLSLCSYLTKLLLMQAVRGENLASCRTSLNACQSWEGSVIERSHCEYDFGKDHLNQIMTAIDLRILKFNSFLSYIFVWNLIHQQASIVQISVDLLLVPIHGVLVSVKRMDSSWVAQMVVNKGIDHMSSQWLTIYFVLFRYPEFLLHQRYCSCPSPSSVSN